MPLAWLWHTPISGHSKRQSSAAPPALTPAASLNRMPILALPGIALEPGSAGMLAFALLSREALANELHRHADALHIDVSSVEEAHLPRLLDRCFESVDPGVHRHIHRWLLFTSAFTIRCSHHG